MKYLIKSLKWTRHYGHDTWYAPNSNGYADRICDAGIYTDKDIENKKDGVTHGVIEFVPLTQELVELGEEQVTREISKLEEWLAKEKQKLDRIKNMKNELIAN